MSTFNPPPEGSGELRDSLCNDGLLGKWYRLTAYNVPDGERPTLREQEIIRRSRLTTFVLFIHLVCVGGPVIPIVVAAPNHDIVLPWLLGSICMIVFAFYWNKKGHLTIAGLLMIASIEVTVIIKIWTIPGGMSLGYLPQFDILTQTALLAVVLLPPWFAFVVGTFNIAFVLFSLLAGPHAPNLTAALNDPHMRGEIFAVPIITQLSIATVAYLIISNLLSALKRADKAEQIAILEHSISQSRALIEQRNHELETGVVVIIQTIQTAANNREGCYEQVPLPTGHVLWPVLQQIWHFLDRYQRTRQAEAHMEATIRASTALIQMLEAAQRGYAVPFPPRSNTPIDGITFALKQVTSHHPRACKQTTQTQIPCKSPPREKTIPEHMKN